MNVSEPGTKYIKLKEGTVLNAYRDPVGILTIGNGFTNLSPTVRKWFGGKLKPGMRMTDDECGQLLKLVIDNECAPAVTKGMPGAKQHEFDMGCSGTFNVGARIFNWNWAKAYRSGDIDRAAKLWMNTATTARGKKLPGLVRRRREEARMLRDGVYEGVLASPVLKYDKTPAPEAEGSPSIGEATPPKGVAPDPLVREYQDKLRALGYDPGASDGWMGPKTEQAVLEFQEADKYLINDGILGRATRDSIDRHLEERKTNRTAGWGSVTGIVGSVISWVQGNDIMTYAVVGLFIAVAVYLLWRNRKRVEEKVMELF